MFSYSPFSYVHSDLEQLRRIRRRSPHDDTEAFTVFLRSDVEAKLVLCFKRSSIKFWLVFKHMFCFSPFLRAIDVWGSQEALARERNLRKEMEKEYQESGFMLSLFKCFYQQVVLSYMLTASFTWNIIVFLS